MNATTGHFAHCRCDRCVESLSMSPRQRKIQGLTSRIAELNARLAANPALDWIPNEIARAERELARRAA